MKDMNIVWNPFIKLNYIKENGINVVLTKVGDIYNCRCKIDQRVIYVLDK